MGVRAKFKVDSIHLNLYGKGEELRSVNLTPVYSNDPASENAQFWRFTPTGKIELGTINPEAWKQFELGKEYYIDFTPA